MEARRTSLQEKVDFPRWCDLSLLVSTGGRHIGYGCDGALWVDGLHGASAVRGVRHAPWRIVSAVAGVEGVISRQLRRGVACKGCPPAHWVGAPGGGGKDLSMMYLRCLHPPGGQRQ